MCGYLTLRVISCSSFVSCITVCAPVSLSNQRDATAKSDSMSRSLSFAMTIARSATLAADAAAIAFFISGTVDGFLSAFSQSALDGSLCDVAPRAVLGAAFRGVQPAMGQ
jgi:hypothetical protein